MHLNESNKEEKKIPKSKLRLSIITIGSNESLNQSLQGGV